MDWILDLLTAYNTPLVTTSNYSAVTNIYTLQVTTVLAKPFPALFLHQPFPGNGFEQWKFFSFTRSDILATTARTELDCHLNYDVISS
jgi:hypothetical protein